MGTRHLTAVYMDGQYRVAQYGQWDGYPEGAGITCLQFLRDKMDEQLFRKRLSELRYMSDTEIDALLRKYNRDDEGFMLISDSDRFRDDWPALHRDTGADILEMIQAGQVRDHALYSRLEFAANSLWCEWAWVIDLDKLTFEGYRGYNKEPLTEEDRFWFLREHEEEGYHGVKLVYDVSLKQLPTDEEFVAAFTKEDDE